MQDQSPVVGLVSRNIPGPVADGQDRRLRMGRYGELYVQPFAAKNYAAADEGQYFVVANATVETPLVYVDTDTWSETTCYMLALKDNDAGEFGKRIYMDYIRVRLTLTSGQAPTTATCAIAKIVLDTAGYTGATAAGVALTPVNTNTGFTTPTIAQVYVSSAGMTTAARSGNARQVHNSFVRSSIPTCGDEYVLSFGGFDPANSVILNGAGLTRVVQNVVPVVLTPGWSLLLGFLMPGCAAALKYEIEAAWWER